MTNADIKRRRPGGKNALNLLSYEVGIVRMPRGLLQPDFGLIPLDQATRAGNALGCGEICT